MRLFLLLLPVLLSLPAAAENDRPWTDQAELGFVATGGNTRTTSLSLSNKFAYGMERSTIAVDASLLRSRAAGVDTAEQYSISEKVTLGLGGDNYVFEKVGWDRNPFAGVDGRLNASLGYGRSILNSETDKLNAELGGGYIAEARSVGPDHNFASGRAYAKYTRVLSPTAAFNQDLEYFHDFSLASGWRFYAETSLTASISTRTAMKLGFKYSHVNSPPPGFGEDDTLTTAALVFNF